MKYSVLDENVMTNVALYFALCYGRNEKREYNVPYTWNYWQVEYLAICFKNAF